VVDVRRQKQVLQTALFLAINFIFFAQPKRQFSFLSKDFMRS
jgi:hypothetical protein